MADRNIILSIIIPFYNESGNVKPMIELVVNSIKDECTYEIIAVNDGSMDNTCKELLLLAENNECIKVIEFTRNFGQSAAFQAGFDNANGRYIVTIDGDQQNDPHDIPKMLKKIKETNCDMIVGWRKKRKDPIIKRLPSKIANRIISRFLRLSIHDTGCSLKIFKHDILKDIRLYGEMHRFIPYLAYAKGAIISEMQINHRKRKTGKTKYGLSRTFKVLLDMLTVKFLNEYSTNPIYAIGGLSIIIFILCIFGFTALILMKILLGIDMTGNPLLIISVFLFILAFQFLMLGLISEIQIRTYFESNKRIIYKIKKNSNEEKKT